MPTFGPLAGEVEADVCIIGGGITGLTAALMLARENLRVVLVERHHLGHGVTGSTTAHITSLVDFDYGSIAKKLGTDAVRAVHDSTLAAIDRIAQLVTETGADCDFERVDGHFYAEPGGDADAVRKSAEALREAGITSARLDPNNALPFPTAETLVLPRQARFHPLRYLAAVAAAAVSAGAALHEQTPVIRVREGERCDVETAGGGHIRARYVVSATHTPTGIHFVQTEMHNKRSYVLAAEIEGGLPDGLYFDTAEPYRYIRRHVVDGKELVIVGGADHPTGKGNPVEAMTSLEEYARERLAIREVVARWSAQVYEPADGLPYIGWSPLGTRSILATGFAGDGMVYGTRSAMIAADLVTGRASPWAELYRPARFPARSLKTVAHKGLETSAELVLRRMKRGTKDLEAVRPGEGRIVRHEGRQLAVYRATSGELHASSAVCPHMKCIVHWNDFEKSWDCACHGSRFSAEGTVVEGPSPANLERVHLEGPSREVSRDVASDDAVHRGPPMPRGHS